MNVYDVLCGMSSADLEKENQRYTRARVEMRLMLSHGVLTSEQYLRAKDDVRALQKIIAKILDERAALIREAELAAHGLQPDKTQTIEARSIRSEEGFGSGERAL